MPDIFHPIRAQKTFPRSIFHEKLKVQQRRAWSVIGLVTACLFFFFVHTEGVSGCIIRLSPSNNPQLPMLRPISIDRIRDFE
jgi:hypothetical protein